MRSSPTTCWRWRCWISPGVRRSSASCWAASASKLLARKRPRLCPISDSVVIKAVDVPGRTWDVLCCLLQDPAARAEVEALRPPGAAEASLLRILDVALWVSYSGSAAAQWVREKAEMIDS